MNFKLKQLLILLYAGLFSAQLFAQTEPDAGNWKPWFIPSGKMYRLDKPVAARPEVAGVIARQQQLDSAGIQQILYWNAGAPGARWQEMVHGLWLSSAGEEGVRANMLMGTATYDATIAAWDTKFAWKRPRPFEMDKRIKALIPVSDSPSYPCEHSVAAGVGVAIISHFFPELADSVNRMAQRLMDSRVAAGVAFPSDTKAGFELGKKIAAIEIEVTKNYVCKQKWDGKKPEGPGYWKGSFALGVMSGRNHTVALDTGSQFRPGPPPDFSKDMAELKSYKQTFSSRANAFFYADQSFWEDLLTRKIFEHNLHLNPPRAARINAAAAVGYYDGFTSCWDAKYAYWGIRPAQYDTTYHGLMGDPPFPGYPSGHAAISSVMAEIYAYFFPADRAYFHQKAKDAAESRFQAGIHFRTDNEVGTQLGQKVGTVVIRRVMDDGADGQWPVKKAPSISAKGRPAH